MIQSIVPAERDFLDEVQAFTGLLDRLQWKLGDQAAPTRDEVFHELTQSIRTMSRKCRLFQLRLADGRRIREYQSFFQQAIAPWFDRSWFMQRAKAKPRGYPGDFELLTAIYDGQPKSRGMGGYLDLYFLHSDLGLAVPARMRAARQFLNRQAIEREGDLTVLNVASGPCRELFAGLELHPNGRHVTIHCIDTDPAALAFVQERWTATPHAQVHLQFNDYNALRMRSTKGNVARFGRADIIYSIGLLDYIPDKHLIPMLSGLRGTLKPGGVALLSFKDGIGYDACEYQWFVDWYFLERRESDCHRLLIKAGFDDAQLRLVRDETGIIMNFEATVPHDAPTRVDDAHACLPVPVGMGNMAVEPADY